MAAHEVGVTLLSLSFGVALIAACFVGFGLFARSTGLT
jgi:hypothetical protein